MMLKLKDLTSDCKREILAFTFLLLVTIFLRSAFPLKGPDGWRDDELSNTLVIAEKVLDGDIRLYYPDASGHEGLYHWLQAAFFAVFGETYFGIRGASVLLGVISVIVIYFISRSILDWRFASLASLLLTSSFWSLLYSRTGHRHIAAVVFTSLTFLLVIVAIKSEDEKVKRRNFIIAGIVGGLSLYTYFVARGLPFILLGYTVYLRLFFPEVFRSNARGLATSLIIMSLISIPLIRILSVNPASETRVSEVAIPIKDALDGDFSTLSRYAMVTLSMFTNDGDDEVLYNIPHRPIFSLFWGLLLWTGVLLTSIDAFKTKREDPIPALLLAWFFAGLIPGMVSIPAASLSHTILAQFPSYIFPVISASWAFRRIKQWGDKSPVLPLFLILIIGFTGYEMYRGIYDFFIVWPQDGFNRMHHHSALREASVVLNESTASGNIAMAGFLSERWDQQAFRIDLDQKWQVREFDPYSAMLFIGGGTSYVIPDFLEDTWAVKEYLIPLDPDGHLYSLNTRIPDEAALASFENGLTLTDIFQTDADEGYSFNTIWRVDRHLVLPDFPLYAKPPAPGEDNSPRLRIFFHLLDKDGEWAAGADAIGVDPYTLFPGDIFVQRHLISADALASGCYSVAVGLYNPLTGERVFIQDAHLDAYLASSDTGLSLCIP